MIVMQVVSMLFLKKHIFYGQTRQTFYSLFNIFWTNPTMVQIASLMDKSKTILL